MKTSVSKEKFACSCSPVVLDYGDTRFSNFKIEYLCETFCETVFACSYGAQVESFKLKNGLKSRDTDSYQIHSHPLPVPPSLSKKKKNSTRFMLIN